MPDPDQGEMTTEGGRQMQSANLFDLRRIIGALFVLYGIVLTVMGAFDSHAEVARAAGVRINLWAGLGMLLFGLSFLAWGILRPLTAELGDEGPAEDRT
jgi:hypothetical protein